MQGLVGHSKNQFNRMKQGSGSEVVQVYKHLDVEGETITSSKICESYGINVHLDELKDTN